jgi:lipoate-protein ligase B
MPATPLPLDYYLVGHCDLDQAFQWQRRLAYEVSDFLRPRIAVVMCEHPGDVITVGRDGSHSHIRYTGQQLRHMQVDVRWVGRGGGCIPHTRGQLAVYPVVPLHLAGWTVGDYLRRFQAGIRAALEQFNVHTSVRDNRFGIWGQSGLLAAFGIAVRNWVTSHGAFLNVNPAMTLFQHVDTEGRADAGTKTTMTSLLAERRVAVTMSAVRTAVMDHLSSALETGHYHVHAALPGSHDSRHVAGEACAHI